MGLPEPDFPPPSRGRARVRGRRSTGIPVVKQSLNGFTLLELLMATTMITLIIVVAYESYIGSLKAARAGGEEIDCYQTGRAVLATIADDLRSAVMTRGVFGFGLRGQDGDDAKYESDTLDLSCTNGPRWRPDPTDVTSAPLPPRGDFRRITWHLITPEQAADETPAPGIRPSLGLVRDVRTNLLSQDAGEQTEQAISRSVLSLQIQFYDGTTWQEVWDSGASNQMPVAVKVTVMVLPREEDLMSDQGERPAGTTLAEMYPQARTFTTVIHLPSAAPPQGARVMQ